MRSKSGIKTLQRNIRVKTQKTFNHKVTGHDYFCVCTVQHIMKIEDLMRMQNCCFFIGYSVRTSPAAARWSHYIPGERLEALGFLAFIIENLKKKIQASNNHTCMVM